MESISAAFIIGLLGAGHCIGMCGGIGASLSFAVRAESKSKRLLILVGYNIGRISSYAFAGALLAGLAATSQAAFGFPYLRIVAAVLLVLMGLYLADVWRGLVVLERLGKHMWVRIQPLSKALLPVVSFKRALLFGAIWGWLPCGLVYTALAFSATAGDSLGGAALMVAFGLGTFPAVFAGGVAANAVRSILQGLWFRRLTAVFLVLFGVWTFWGAIVHSGHANHSAHAHHTDRASTVDSVLDGLSGDDVNDVGTHKPHH